MNMSTHLNQVERISPKTQNRLRFTTSQPCQVHFGHDFQFHEREGGKKSREKYKKRIEVYYERNLTKERGKRRFKKREREREIMRACQGCQ